MALIRCTECNHEISDTARTCPNCGFSMIEKNVKTTTSNKNKWGKFVLIGLILMIIICGAVIGILNNLKQAPAKMAMNMIVEEKGEDATFYKVYYNKEENACVVYFNNGKVDDIAVVLLDSNEVGYQNLYELTELGMVLANTEEQRNKIAQEIINDPYDPVYVLKVEQGNEQWKLICDYE